MSTDDCIFCRIIAGELPSTVVRENDAAFAFRDLHPHQEEEGAQGALPTPEVVEKL